jgi:hypothetical protein
MVQIVYEHQESWSEDGILSVNIPPIEGNIYVSPNSARQRANGYLARYIGLVMEAGKPVLIWQKQPVWRMSIYLSLRGFGQIARLGKIEVDATTCEIIPLSQKQIITIQDRADEIATCLT